MCREFRALYAASRCGWGLCAWLSPPILIYGRPPVRNIIRVAFSDQAITAKCEPCISQRNDHTTDDIKFHAVTRGDGETRRKGGLLPAVVKVRNESPANPFPPAARARGPSHDAALLVLGRPCGVRGGSHGPRLVVPHHPPGGMGHHPPHHLVHARRCRYNTTPWVSRRRGWGER
jgi:hypothetical protein